MGSQICTPWVWSVSSATPGKAKLRLSCHRRYIKVEISVSAVDSPAEDIDALLISNMMMALIVYYIRIYILFILD
jgi:hypothetical protein